MKNKIRSYILSSASGVNERITRWVVGKAILFLLESKQERDQFSSRVLVRKKTSKNYITQAMPRGRIGSRLIGEFTVTSAIPEFTGIQG